MNLRKLFGQKNPPPAAPPSVPPDNRPLNLDPKHITFRGPPMDDPEMLSRLPADLRRLLTEVNGFILFDGGLHIRGACLQPDWHSLRKVWEGELALPDLYTRVQYEDVPFGEDCLGDQFLLRDGIVYRLAAETGELSSLNSGLFAFLDEAQKDPVNYLNLQPLLQFQREQGRSIKPGELLDAYPLFCTAESANGVDLKAVPALKRLSFLAHVAAQISKLPDGAKIQIKFVD
jgi:hypothetical protein